MATALIVDDDEDARKVLAAHLRKAGYTVQAAPNGRQALVALITSYPDVVILDYMMPEMNGIEFLDVIRSYLRWSRLPVVLLTAYEGEHLKRARELGVKSIFLKASYHISDLLDCIKAARQDTDGGGSGGIGA